MPSQGSMKETLFERERSYAWKEHLESLTRAHSKLMGTIPSGPNLAFLQVLTQQVKFVILGTTHPMHYGIKNLE
jgi:hypothetical protein